MLVGDDSPHIDDVVDMNGRMDPEETDFMKVTLIMVQIWEFLSLVQK